MSKIHEQKNRKRSNFFYEFQIARKLWLSQLNNKVYSYFYFQRGQRSLVWLFNVVVYSSGIFWLQITYLFLIKIFWRKKIILHRVSHSDCQNFQVLPKKSLGSSLNVYRFISQFHMRIFFFILNKRSKNW